MAFSSDSLRRIYLQRTLLLAARRTEWPRSSSCLNCSAEEYDFLLHVYLIHPEPCVFHRNLTCCRKTLSAQADHPRPTVFSHQSHWILPHFNHKPANGHNILPTRAGDPRCKSVFSWTPLPASATAPLNDRCSSVIFGQFSHPPVHITHKQEGSQQQPSFRYRQRDQHQYYVGTRECFLLLNQGRKSLRLERVEEE